MKTLFILIFTLISANSIGQESAFLTFTHQESKKVYALNKGARVKIKYANNSGEIQKLAAPSSGLAKIVCI